MKRKLRLSLVMCALLSISSLVNAQDVEEAQLDPAAAQPEAPRSKTGYQYKQLDGYNHKDATSGSLTSGTAERAPTNFGGTKKAVPFDGGLTLLLAAGAGIAAKKKYDQKKKNRVINSEA